MSWFRRRADDVASPPAPQDVKLVRADGSVVPLDLVYDGLVDGIHRWSAVTDVRFELGDQLTAEMIPAHTAISLPVAPF